MLDAVEFGLQVANIAPPAGTGEDIRSSTTVLIRHKKPVEKKKKNRKMLHVALAVAELP